MITHEQATALRAIKLGFAVTSQSNAQLYLKPFIAAGSFIYWRLNDEGEAALAEYDARFTTVEKSELARLQALERKIAAFLGSMRRTKCAIEIGTPEQMWVSFNQNESCWELNLHEPVDGRYFIETQSQGDAMRKAFELFELFEVPKEAEG